MMKKAYILWLTLFYYKHNLEGIVIIIHGSFATNATWYRPGGDFYQVLEREAKRRGEMVIPFTWSGKITTSARLEAAEALAKIIISYAPQPVTLIGHSHGGNVIQQASQLLAQETINKPITGTDDIPAFLSAYRRVNPLARSTHKQYLIEQVYLLATPLNVGSLLYNIASVAVTD